MTQADFGKRVKARREELNMSQETLSSLMGYKTRSSIQKIEAGKSDIPQAKIKQLAQALNTTVAYLLNWTDDPTPPRNTQFYLRTPESEFAMKLLHAYENADKKTQSIVRQLLDI